MARVQCVFSVHRSYTVLPARNLFAPVRVSSVLGEDTYLTMHLPTTDGWMDGWMNVSTEKFSSIVAAAEPSVKFQPGVPAFQMRVFKTRQVSVCARYNRANSLIRRQPGDKSRGSRE